MAFIPMEYDGGGTLLTTSSTSVSAYNATNGYVDLCSLTLTKGIWIVTAALQRTTSESELLIARFTGANTTGRFCRGIGTSGGGVYLAEILNVTSASATLKLQGYRFSDVTTTSTFQANMQAFKLSD